MISEKLCPVCQSKLKIRYSAKALRYYYCSYCRKVYFLGDLKKLLYA